MSYECSFAAELWEWDGQAAWHFVSLPEHDADELAEIFDGRERGFGSIRVEVTIGASTWRTSVFPDAKRGTYLLPVKKAVRTKEGIGAGSVVRVDLAALDPTQ